MHALVLMANTGESEVDADLQYEHEAFIDDLDRANKVILGGGWTTPAGGFDAAYLLSCVSLDEARKIAASDPLVRAGAIRSEVVEWELVGVNPDAIDRSSLLNP